MRYVAALMVFVHHLAPRHFHPLINNFIIELQAGVPVFFTLSGFLICHRYYQDAATGNIGWFKKYLVNRFARIYPVFFIVTVVNCLYRDVDSIGFILNISMLHGFFSNYVFNPLPQTWSLTVEATFYIFIPLIFYLFRKKIPVILQAFLFLALGAILTYATSKTTMFGFFKDINFMLVLTFFGRCFEFLSGVYLCLLISKNKEIIAPQINFTWLSAFLLPALIVFISLVGGLNSYKGIFLHNIFLPVTVCGLIYGLITEHTLIRTFLSGKIMDLLGKSSYCFFLFHVGFIHSFFNKYIISNLLIELIFTTTLSVFAFKFLEEPLNRKIKKLVG